MPFASLDFRSRTIASSLDDEINAKVKKWLRWAQFFSHNASNKTLLKLNTRQQGEKWVSGYTYCLDASPFREQSEAGTRGRVLRVWEPLVLLQGAVRQRSACAKASLTARPSTDTHQPSYSGRQVGDAGTRLLPATRNPLRVYQRALHGRSVRPSAQHCVFLSFTSIRTKSWSRRYSLYAPSSRRSHAIWPSPQYPALDIHPEAHISPS